MADTPTPIVHQTPKKTKPRTHQKTRGIPTDAREQMPHSVSPPVSQETPHHKS